MIALGSVRLSCGDKLSWPVFINATIIILILIAIVIEIVIVMVA